MNFTDICINFNGACEVAFIGEQAEREGGRRAVTTEERARRRFSFNVINGFRTDRRGATEREGQGEQMEELSKKLDSLLIPSICKRIEEMVLIRICELILIDRPRRADGRPEGRGETRSD